MTSLLSTDPIHIRILARNLVLLYLESFLHQDWGRPAQLSLRLSALSKLIIVIFYLINILYNKFFKKAIIFQLPLIMKFSSFSVSSVLLVMSSTESTTSEAKTLARAKYLESLLFKLILSPSLDTRKTSPSHDSITSKNLSISLIFNTFIN